MPYFKICSTKGTPLKVALRIIPQKSRLSTQKERLYFCIKSERGYLVAKTQTYNQVNLI